MYNIINDKEISTHLPIEAYADFLYKVTSADKSLDTLEALSNYTAVMSKSVKIDITNPDIKVHGKAKGRYQWAIINKNTIFSFTFNKKNYFASEIAGSIECSLKLEDIKEKLHTYLNPDQTGLSASEKKVSKWLDSSHTGSSSLAMCHAMYPKLKEHHKIKNLIEHSMTNSFPHDNSDFKRCMDFLKAAGLKSSDVKAMKTLNPQWENLAKNWDAIETLMNTPGDDARKEAYMLIRESTKALPKPKAPKLIKAVK